MYFSLRGERKVPKERHLREAWRPPLRNPPSPRDPFAHAGRRGLIARKVEDTRYPARTAERRPRGNRPRRGEERGIMFRISANRPNPRARRSAEVADCRRPVNYPRIRPFCPRQKGSAGQGIGSARKGPGSFPCVAILLVLFFRHGKKSTRSITPNLSYSKMQINPPLPSLMIRSRVSESF